MQAGGAQGKSELGKVRGMGRPAGALQVMKAEGEAGGEAPACDTAGSSGGRNPPAQYGWSRVRGVASVAGALRQGAQGGGGGEGGGGGGEGGGVGVGEGETEKLALLLARSSKSKSASAQRIAAGDNYTLNPQP